MNRPEGFVAAYVECRLCGHRWTAVFPLQAETLECPNCHNNTEPAIVTEGEPVE